MHPLAAPGSLWVLSNDGKYLARPLAGETSHKKQISCRRQEKGLPFFSVSQRISPLRRRPKGFPIALWKPSASCCNANRNLHKKQFPCKKQKTGLSQSPPINANSHGGHSFHRGHIVFITFSPEQHSPVPAPPGPESPGQCQIHIPPGPAARASRNRCPPRKRPPHHWRRRNRPCTGCPCIR